VLRGGICEFLWLGDNDVTMSMVKQAYQNFNINILMSIPQCLSEPLRSPNRSGRDYCLPPSTKGYCPILESIGDLG
jgi:hypothetical protein